MSNPNNIYCPLHIIVSISIYCPSVVNDDENNNDNDNNNGNNNGNDDNDNDNNGELTDRKNDEKNKNKSNDDSEDIIGTNKYSDIYTNTDRTTPSKKINKIQKIEKIEKKSFLRVNFIEISSPFNIPILAPLSLDHLSGRSLSNISTRNIKLNVQNMSDNILNIDSNSNNKNDTEKSSQKQSNNSFEYFHNSALSYILQDTLSQVKDFFILFLFCCFVIHNFCYYNFYFNRFDSICTCHQYSLFYSRLRIVFYSELNYCNHYNYYFYHH